MKKARSRDFAKSMTEPDYEESQVLIQIRQTKHMETLVSTRIQFKLII